jgi:hypothetical protein
MFQQLCVVGLAGTFLRVKNEYVENGDHNVKPIACNAAVASDMFRSSAMNIASAKMNVSSARMTMRCRELRRRLRISVCTLVSLRQKGEVPKLSRS